VLLGRQHTLVVTDFDVTPEANLNAPLVVGDDQIVEETNL